MEKITTSSAVSVRRVYLSVTRPSEYVMASVTWRVSSSLPHLGLLLMKGSRVCYHASYCDVSAVVNFSVSGPSKAHCDVFFSSHNIYAKKQ